MFLFRTRGDESLNTKIFTEGPIRVTRRVKRYVSHSTSMPYVTNNRVRGRNVLEKHRSEKFHHVVAQLLFMSSIPKSDIQMAVSSLATRVKQPDDYYRGKPKRVLKYRKEKNT